MQLPRLATFLGQHGCEPPAGYEEYAIDLLKESAGEGAHWSARDLSIADDALSTLQKVGKLARVPIARSA
jgi:hypothetical protein